MAHLRDTYSPIASPDGIEDLFLVIDVVGGAGHPPVRFIYATRVTGLTLALAPTPTLSLTLTLTLSPTLTLTLSPTLTLRPSLSPSLTLIRRVAYLVIDPAHLAFLTASLLKPPVVRERVHFYDG